MHILIIGLPLFFLATGDLCKPTGKGTRKRSKIETIFHIKNSALRTRLNAEIGNEVLLMPKQSVSKLS